MMGHLRSLHQTRSGPVLINIVPGGDGDGVIIVLSHLTNQTLTCRIHRCGVQSCREKENYS